MLISFRCKRFYEIISHTRFSRRAKNDEQRN